jgi:formylmethanofuran dehydrogenase subunit E
MVVVPEWAFEFHGHGCPFMPLGYRMGLLAMRELGVEHEQDHGLFAFSEMGSGHPNTCMEDGIQVATGSTYAKRIMQHLDYGKAAFVLYHPDKGAVRVSLRPEAFDELGKFEFMAYRKKGLEPSRIPQEVVQEVVDWVLNRDEKDLFAVGRLPDFVYQRPGPNPFEKVRCAKCGEYVFERYVRLVQGQPRCIPCSGYRE